jgi:hypothetical protein
MGCRNSIKGVGEAASKSAAAGSWGLNHVQRRRLDSMVEEEVIVDAKRSFARGSCAPQVI